jgi:hypothetical protein
MSLPARSATPGRHDQGDHCFSRDLRYLTGALAPRAGLAAVAASVALTLAVAVLGPSVMEPVLPGRAGQPPWAFGAHPSPYLAVGLTAAALAAGALGLVLVLRALRCGWSVPARAVLLAGLAAAVALTLVPPFGSSDQLSYAGYGRMLVTGHNPYTTTPAQLAALGDPVARAVQDWFTSSSVYGPLATGVQGLAALVGGTSARLTVFILGLANLAAFAGAALVLHRMTRRDPAAQLRAAVLWAANPLLLQLLVAGAHVDGQAVFFAVAAVAVLLGPWSGERPSVPPVTRAVLAGVLAGLGFAVKVSDVLVVLGLAVALVLRGQPAGRRLLPSLAALTAGFAVVAGAAVTIGGRAMLGQLSRESDMVSIGSPWRVIRTLIHLAVGGTAATDIIKAGAVALTVLLAVLLVRGLPGAADPGAGAAFAVVLAWLFAWPYVLPWYDALAWALLALLAWPAAAGLAGRPAAAGLAGRAAAARVAAGTAAAGTAAAERLGWLLLAWTTALGFGYLPARQTGAVLPRGLSWLQPVIRHGVTPAVLATATVWLVVVMERSRRSRPVVPEGAAGAPLTVTEAR